MAEANGQTNGATEKVKSTFLDLAKETFEKRKAPAKDAEIVAVLTKYFKADDEVQALQKKLDEAKLKRTETCKEVVALRGMTRIKTKTRGIGQIINRGESAWINFGSVEGEALDL